VATERSPVGLPEKRPELVEPPIFVHHISDHIV
jgi:hypothetical protein